MNNDFKSEKSIHEEITLANKGLDITLDYIKENLFDLDSYNEKIHEFEFSPTKDLANNIILNSSDLYQTDHLKLTTDKIEESLGIIDLNSSFIDNKTLSTINEGITSLINDPLTIQDSILELKDLDNSWVNKFDPLKLDIDFDDIQGTIRLPELDLTTNKITTEALLSESTYLNLDNIGDNIYSNLKIDPTEIIQDFSETFSQFSNLISVQDVLSSGFTLQDDILSLSSNELLSASSVLESLSISDNFQLNHYGEKRSLIQSKVEESYDELEKMLNDLDKGLIQMLRGAEESLGSTNPDRVRHFGTSLRELFTHVIHQLAPDQEIQSWTTDPNHFKDGNPTRRARLLYISRKCSNKSFQNFLDADVKSVLSFISVFQGLTHSVENDFTDQQLSGMLKRMRSTLYLLISTSRA